MFSKELCSYIQRLSKDDKKNLQGKLTKHTSELGELASAVQSYEGAPGAAHKFVTKQQILDEVADNILCALSIAFDLDFNDEEIADMVLLKAKKWNGLQAKEQTVKAPYPFEIHITVDRERINVERFREICASLNVKATILNLQDGLNQFVFQDVMTSSTHFGDNKSVLAEVERIENGLKLNDIALIRSKIETIPFHPAAPSEKNGITMPPNCYFESHLEITIQNEVEAQMLSKLVDTFGIKFSQNISKIFGNEQKIISITLRENKLHWEAFHNKLQQLEVDLLSYGFKIHDQITEFSIFDTNILHDAKWINL